MGAKKLGPAFAMLQSAISDLVGLVAARAGTDSEHLKFSWPAAVVATGTFAQISMRLQFGSMRLAACEPVYFLHGPSLAFNQSVL
eukprot:6176346-Pleurochrysis_carterae.AAC.2